MGVAIAEIIVYISLLMVSVSFHEAAHGFMAAFLGDDTAKREGRLTLNPLAHIDLYGSIIMPLIIFFISHGKMMYGYAKPVPINLYVVKNRKRALMLVAAAGPLSNLLLAILFSALFKAGLVNFPVLAAVCIKGIFINVLLAAFNLIPIPPLDGSRILAGLLPDDMARAYNSIEPYGIFILIGLIFTGILDISGFISFLYKIVLF